MKLIVKNFKRLEQFLLNYCGVASIVTLVGAFYYIILQNIEVSKIYLCTSILLQLFQIYINKNKSQFSLSRVFNRNK